jgi:hypothetical protein
MKSTALSFVCVALLSASVARSQPPAQPGQQYVAYIVRVTGDWALQTGAGAGSPTKVTQWQELLEGSRLVPAGSTGQLTVMLIDGRTVVLDASKPQTWKQPIHLATGSEAAGGSKWIRLAMRWLSEKPQVVVPAMARGTRDVAPLLDRVVQWSVDGLDPAPLLGTAARQPLILRFETLDKEGRRLPEDSLIVDWDPSEGRKPSIPLRPALYRVVALDPEGVDAGREAWILVVEPPRFARSSQLFDELARTVAPWADADARSARGFLRAALLVFANDASGS